MVDGFRSECKACRVATRLAWRKAHPGRDYESQRRYFARHPERVRAYQRSYWSQNREHLNAKGREYAKKYSADYYRVKALRRRGREIAAGGTCTQDDIARMHQEQGGLCFYCGREYGEQYEVDHFIPVIAGGHGGLDNLVIACRFCNRSKGGKLPWEFMPDQFEAPEADAAD